MFRRLRHVLPVFAVVAVLLQPEIASADDPPVGDGSSGARSQVTADPADLHLVRLSDDLTSPDEMTEAIEDAGGQVVDLLAPLRLALVATDGPGITDQVREGEGIVGSARNRPIGSASPADGERRLDVPAPMAVRNTQGHPEAESGPSTASDTSQDPLASRQWGNDMVGATSTAAHGVATGRGVTVGIIDTGIDASHPDLAPNLDLGRSRDLVSPGARPDVDPHGHGTHVAGIVAAARDDLGITGVAPDATLVNLRAGQESGYFFVHEVASALFAATYLNVDVVVMSFFTDPWLYNCESADDYIRGEVHPEEIAEQALIRRVMLDALRYAHRKGVTLVAAAGNGAVDMAAPEREDAGSPGHPAGAARHRVVTDNCLDLPAEGPEVLTVSAVGPSGARAEYSNHGLGSIDLAAPGGWFGDHAGTDAYGRPENMVLSSYPVEAAQRRGLADEDGHPTPGGFVHRDCRDGECGLYIYFQGTSMAAPYVAGVAALAVEGHGSGSSWSGPALAPERVREILTATATGQPCPASEPTGQDAEYHRSPTVPCVGNAEKNSLYGHGIVSAVGAVGGLKSLR